MSKRTRRERARELLDTLRTGPAFSMAHNISYSPKEAGDLYQLWVKSWVLPEVEALIPELAKQNGKRAK